MAAYDFMKQAQASTGADGTKYLPRGGAAPTASYGAQTPTAIPAGTGGYRGPTTRDNSGWAMSGTDDPGGRGNGTAPPAANGWQQGPTLQMGQGSTPSQGPNIGNTPTGPGYGQSANQGWSPQADYQNPDGSWHQNPSYGQGGSDIGRNPPRQTSGEGGPAGGASPQWGTRPGIGGAQQAAAQGQAGGAAGGPQWGGGAPNWSSYAPPTNINMFEDEGYRKRLAAMNNASLPFLQAGQNAYQYQNDADEAKRRFDMQYGQTGQQNQWQQGFSDRQQTAAEQQASLAGNQWAIQNNQQNVNDNRNYGLSDRNMAMQEAGQQQNYNLAQNAQQFGQQNADRQFGFQGQQWKDQMGLQNSQLGLQQVQNSQQYGLAQSAQMLDKLKNSQQYGLQDRGMSLQELQNGQQYGLQQGALDLSKLTQEQNNALQTGQLTLAQVAQQQNAAYQQGQLGLGNRGLDLQDWQQRQGMDLQNRSLAQQLQMQQAQLAQAKEASYMAATGHNLKPNARWLRST